MRVCILGRSEFDIALARAMNIVGIQITNDPKNSDYVLSNDKRGIKISNDMSESADIHLAYAADITQDIKQHVKWSSDVLYFGPWDKRLISLSTIQKYRVCFFTGDEKWAENWCGTYEANYKNLTSIVYATKVLISFEDSMVRRLANFFGKVVLTKVNTEEVLEVLEKPERYPVSADKQNTIFDRLRELLILLGGKATVYADLCEYEKQARIECLGL